MSESNAMAATASEGDLPRRTLLFYALPTIGMTIMHWLIMVFLLKFSTDTLGLAPAVVGGLFAAGRLWDALSDPLAGWFSDRTRTRLGRRRPWMLAAALPLGVAFYALLALFPGIAACIAIAGLLVDPAVVVDNIETIGSLLPPSAAELIVSQAAEVAGSQNGGLGLTALVALALAFWSVSRGVRSLIQGLNIAYREPERRGILSMMTVSFVLTIWLILGFLMAVFLWTVLPAVLFFVSFTDQFEFIVNGASWVVLILFSVVGLTLFYRVAPSRRPPVRGLVTPGAVLATALWLAGSSGFAQYIANFGTYQESFGALAGVMILLIWLWLSAFIVLFGAEVDAVIAVRARQAKAAE